jgi:hypothetical protein
MRRFFSQGIEAVQVAMSIAPIIAPRRLQKLAGFELRVSRRRRFFNPKRLQLT